MSIEDRLRQAYGDVSTLLSTTYLVHLAVEIGESFFIIQPNEIQLKIPNIVTEH